MCPWVSQATEIPNRRVGLALGPSFCCRSGYFDLSITVPKFPSSRVTIDVLQSTSHVHCANDCRLHSSGKLVRPSGVVEYIATQRKIILVTYIVVGSLRMLENEPTCLLCKIF